MILGVDARELQGNPTGTGRYLRGLLRAWSETPEGPIVAYVRNAAVEAALPFEVVRLGGPATRGLVWQEALLPAALRRDGIDVFFSPAYMCPLRTPVPCVIAVHDISFFSWPQDFTPIDGLRRRLLAGLSIRRARGILACSEFTRREIVARFPSVRQRVHHVTLGADGGLPPAPERDVARRALGLQGPCLLWVGSLFNRRCIVELLLALAALRRTWPDIHLEIIGDNRTHPRLDVGRLVERLGLQGHVRTSGFVDDQVLSAHYAAADLVVYLSEYEGFGLPVIEAMARGVPVVTADRPATSELAAEAAAVVDPRDVRGLAHTLDTLLRDPARRALLSDAGRRLAARHPWSTTAQATRAVLLEAAHS